jgi:phosphosulfolactate synthase
MLDHLLDLPPRASKPRTVGLTMVIDNGMPTGVFEDAVHSSAELIDGVKFGWGTALVTAELDRKVRCLRELGIRFCFGGTLFEKFVLQDRFEAFLDLCRMVEADLVEVSNGTIALGPTDKARYIRRCATEFTVVSEVGYKDPARSARLRASDWVEQIGIDLAAGASWVITEARESGTSGICAPDGTLREGLIGDILAAGVPAGRLIFEAPSKGLQTRFVTELGPDVNLGNVAPADVIGLETLRRGLRADTLFLGEGTSRASAA